MSGSRRLLLGQALLTGSRCYPAGSRSASSGMAKQEYPRPGNRIRPWLTSLQPSLRIPTLVCALSVAPALAESTQSDLSVHDKGKQYC